MTQSPMSGMSRYVTMVTWDAQPDMYRCNDEEEVWLARSPKSDTEFRQVYDECFPAIRSYCLRRIPAGDVNDAIAETFLVAWRRFDDAPRGSETRLWLYGIARNVVRNSQRSDRRRLRLHTKVQGLRPTPDIDPETIVVRRSEDEQVLRALAALRPADREVIRLSIWEDLSNTEIAIVLGIDPHAVTMRLTRARKRVAHNLGIHEATTSVTTSRVRTDPQPIGEGGEQ